MNHCHIGNIMQLGKINLEDKFTKLREGDYAVGINRQNEQLRIQVVKFKGDFVWHSHPDTDETFIILEGTMS